MVKWKERYSLIIGTMLSIHYLQHLNSNQNHFNTCSRICNCPFYIPPITFYVCHLSSHWIWQAHCFSPESSQLENGMKLFNGSTSCPVAFSYSPLSLLCILLSFEHNHGITSPESNRCTCKASSSSSIHCSIMLLLFSSHLIMHIFYFSDPLGRAKYPSKIAH